MGEYLPKLIKWGVKGFALVMRIQQWKNGIRQC